ncbi:MAG TPA: hypothetical protein VMX13_06890 [Sedimentisphaerales bacterium]|nr:hypothetical protein [Sedimentisphaerales bacterium]
MKASNFSGFIRRGIIALPVVCLAAALLAWGQNGDDYELGRSAVGGGGTISGGNFTMTVTIGEPCAGVMTGGDFTLVGGVSLGYFGPPIEVRMRFTAQTVYRDSRGKWVKAHFELPEEFSPEDVDLDAQALARPMGIESHHINVFIDEGGRLVLEAAFDRKAFCAAVTTDGPIEVVVIGRLVDGRFFRGCDSIRIMSSP